MGIHTFRIGELVTLRLAPSRKQEKAYEITRLLPGDGSEPTYRIKTVGEPFERTAREFELCAMKSAHHLSVLP